MIDSQNNNQEVKGETKKSTQDKNPKLQNVPTQILQNHLKNENPNEPSELQQQTAPQGVVPPAPTPLPAHTSSDTPRQNGKVQPSSKDQKKPPVGGVGAAINGVKLKKTPNISVQRSTWRYLWCTPRGCR